jgi:hypothetical protein
MDLDNKLALAVEELSYEPSASDRKAKAAFWALARGSKLIDLGNITLSDVRRLIPHTSIISKWGDQAFRSWFTNDQEWRQRVEYMLQLALSSIEEVLVDANATPTAKVRAFEVLARLNDKEPARVKEVRFTDAEVQALKTPEEIRRWLDRQGVRYRRDYDGQTADPEEKHADQTDKVLECPEKLSN